MTTDFCVCEGSNENCRYCYGTGRYSRPRATASKESSKPRATVYNEPSHYEEPPAHHGTAIIKFSKGRKSKLLIRCPYCADYFRLGTLAKHTVKAHSSLNNNASTRLPSDSKSQNEGLTQIEPKCPAFDLYVMLILV